MKKFKMALIQMDCKFCDTKENLKRAEEKILGAKKNGANFICLPEAFNTGYDCENIPEMIKLAESLDGETVNRMRELAKDLEIYIVAPLFIQVSTGIFENTAVLINDLGEVLGNYSKTHLVGKEQLYLKRGSQYPVFNTKYGKIGILICYDSCFPETSRILSLNGADMIIIVAAWRDGSYFKEWWLNNLQTRALENLVFISAVNRVGIEKDSKFCGYSQMVSPIGKVMETCGLEDETILYSDIDMDDVYKVRLENTLRIDRQPQDYSVLTKL